MRNPSKAGLAAPRRDPWSFEVPAALALGALVLLVLACGGDGRPPDAGGQPPADECGAAATVCAVAEVVNLAARTSDFTKVVAMAAPREYECPATPPIGPGGPYPLCKGARAGEERQGFPIVYVPGEAAVDTREALLRALNAWASAAQPGKSDAYGSGGNRLFTVGCAGEPAFCGEKFALVVSNISSIQTRLQAVLFFETEDRQPRLTWTAIGSLTQLTRSDAVLRGGKTAEFLSFEGWPRIGAFYPLRSDAEGCPVAAEVCDVAARVGKAVETADLRSLIAAAALKEYTCPAQRPQGLGGPYPLCDNAAGGEKRSGLTIAYLQSEGIVVDREGALQALDRFVAAAQPAKTDAFGDGGNRLYTVGCPDDAAACKDNFALVFSNLGSVPYRTMLLLFFERSGGEARLAWIAIGPLLDASQQDAVLKGGRIVDFLRFAGWPPLTTFHRLGQ